MPDTGKMAVSSAYIHIPFCVRKCTYCDFCSYPGQTPAVLSAYAAALEREIKAVARWADSSAGPGLQPLETVFVGGGTPTLLSGEQLATILTVLRSEFALSEGCEITLEANPGTVNAESLSRCRSAGFNRISYGLQAVQPGLLKLLGRIHNRDDCARSVEMAVAAGFDSLNVDIMVGLPGQTLADIDETLDFVISLPVDHVSFYSLILEDGTPLKARCDRDPGLLPDEDAERLQYHRVCQRLTEAGFTHYEISNAARPGHSCRHNLVYWQARSYYGFGAAAHSYLQAVRRGNTNHLDDYLTVWKIENSDPFATAEVLERLDTAGIRKETMLLGLRLLEGVRYEDFRNRFGTDMLDVFGAEIDRLSKRGLLTVDAAGVRLTATGLDLANQVFMEFV